MTIPRMTIALANDRLNAQPVSPGKGIRVAAVLYVLLLGYLLLAPQPLAFLGGTGDAVDSAVETTVADWVQHAAAFAVLTVLLIAGFGTPGRQIRIVGIGILYGVFCEIAQAWIPHREFGVLDLLSNMTGVLLGLVLCTIRGKPRIRRPELRGGGIDA